MKSELAIELLRKELRHTEFHLNDKNKAPEFYEEMKNYCESLRMAITSLEILHDEWIDFKHMTMERPQGHWIHSETSKYYKICSVCNYQCIIWNANFCPNCGADMMKGDNNG